MGIKFLEKVKTRLLEFLTFNIGGEPRFNRSYVRLCSKHGANNRPHAGAGNDIDGDTMPGKCVEDPDMGKSPRRAATKGQADFKSLCHIDSCTFCLV